MCPCLCLCSEYINYHSCIVERKITVKKNITLIIPNYQHKCESVGVDYYVYSKCAESILKCKFYMSPIIAVLYFVFDEILYSLTLFLLVLF